MFSGFVCIADGRRFQLTTAKIERHCLDDGCARVDTDDYITLTTHD